MFNNPDFKGNPNWFMCFVVGIAYNATYEFSRTLNISWVDISLSTKGPFSSPSIDDGIFSLFVMLLFLIPALKISIKRCYGRIKNNEIATSEALKQYFISLTEFAGAFLLLVLLAPIIMPYLRGWK